MCKRFLFQINIFDDTSCKLYLDNNKFVVKYIFNYIYIYLESINNIKIAILLYQQLPDETLMYLCHF